MVYLDLTHKSREFLDNRLGGIMDIYTKFTGIDPYHPLRIAKSEKEVFQTIKENRIVDPRNPVYSNENFLSSKLKWRG